MKLSLKYSSSNLKNIFKYILDIHKIKFKFSKFHIYFDDKDELIVKNTYKYLLKNILQIKVPQIITNTIIINNKLPELNVTFSVNNGSIRLTGTITNTHNSPITNCGFNIYYVVKANNNNLENMHTIVSPCVLYGDNTFNNTYAITENCSNLMQQGAQLYNFNYQAYATNNSGTTNTIFNTYNLLILCIVENTYITLFDRSQKYIQDITYDDLLLVWDFDNSKFTYSKPLWIKKAQESDEYYSAIFNDGKELNFINKHRIYNNNKGKFTNLFKKEDITTITQDNICIDLLKVNTIKKTVKYYNIITDYHMNFYANGILTSCRYNNLYPIKNMKFVKNVDVIGENKEFDSLLTLSLLPLKYINGMRLKEQRKYNNSEYINRLIINEYKINKLFDKKKILFLDHGGVMTSLYSNTQDFDIQNINYIRQIVKNFCLEIVISSDWIEIYTFEEIKLLYKKYNIDIPIDYTHKNKYISNSKFPDISYSDIRAKEILEWINSKNYKVSDVIIIDDLDLRKYFSPDIFLWIQDGLLSDNL